MYDKIIDTTTEVYCLENNNINNISNVATVQAPSYDSKTYTQKTEDAYWYQWGYDKSTRKDYLRVGNVAKYEICYEDLSSSQQKVCDRYEQAIKDYNDSMIRKNYYSSFAAYGLSFLVVFVAVASIPVAGWVAVIIFTFGVLVTHASNMAAVSKYYKETQDLYLRVRNYGAKY